MYCINWIYSVDTINNIDRGYCINRLYCPNRIYIMSIDCIMLLKYILQNIFVQIERSIGIYHIDGGRIKVFYQ